MQYDGEHFMPKDFERLSIHDAIFTAACLSSSGLVCHRAARRANWIGANSWPSINLRPLGWECIHPSRLQCHSGLALLPSSPSLQPLPVSGPSGCVSEKVSDTPTHPPSSPSFNSSSLELTVMRAVVGRRPSFPNFKYLFPFLIDLF